jgi:3-hydroxymyristoyl/3-hydroxydecanoyl-(acyl carrier protein) dehydratase
VTPLPTLAGLTRERGAVHLTLELTPDMPAFDGHFPGTPILPAVAQIDWALRIARDQFELPAHFVALRALKFMQIVQPPVNLALDLARSDDGSSVTFAYSREGTACASGRIEFADDAPGPDRSLL